MGEYSVGVRCFDGIRDCEECKTNYKSGYEFMYLSCGCGCKTAFRICSVCSPMYMKCECGCKGSFDVCKQRPEYGNMNVSYLYFFILFIWYFGFWGNFLKKYDARKKIFFFRMWRIKMVHKDTQEQAQEQK